jgi:hypothetical protein
MELKKLCDSKNYLGSCGHMADDVVESSALDKSKTV